MKTIEHLLSEEFISALGWTLIHALWQGAVFAIILAILLVLTHRYSSRTRYFISIISLSLFAISALLSFSLLYNPSHIEATQVAAVTKEAPVTATSGEEKEEVNTAISDPKRDTAAAVASTGLYQQAKAYFNQHLPLIVTLWMLGVVVLLLRFLGSLAYIQRLKSYRTELLPDYWLEKGRRLSQQLHMSKKVAFLASHRVLTPLAIGIFKPAILLPSKLLSGLSEQQIEAILLHELAHIKRNDYLVNILQTLVDILFFYHPAIWWMSAAIRNERENCCDDIVISITGETGNYARTLILLKEQEINPKLPAMAFTGVKYKFNNRIKRLFNQPPVFADFREGFVTALILIAGLFTIAINAFGMPALFSEGQQSVQNKEELIEMPGTEANVLELAQVNRQEETNLTPDTEGPSSESNILLNRITNPIKDNDLKLLLEAINDGNLELVKFIVGKGANVNAQTEEGWSPLMEAIDEGNIEIVEYLLEKGAKLNLKTKEGYSPLMIAVSEGQEEIVALLIKKGANVNEKTPKDISALTEAINEGNLNIARLLVENGADLKITYNDLTPLLEATREGQVEIVRLLLENGADPNQEDDDGLLPIIEAAEEGNLEIIRVLLDNGANINAKDHHEITAFLVSVEEGHLEIAKFLLTRGADINIGYEGKSPLMIAAKEGQLEVAKFLIQNGADVNSKDDNDFSILMEAIDEGHLEMVELLINNGADVNAETEDGYTALMEAANEGHLEITRLLLNKGAKISPEGNNSWSAFFEAINEGHIELVKLYLDKGENVNATIDNGHTALIEAVEEGNLAIAQLLISRGANVNAHTSEGHTALIEAVDETNLDMIKLLIDKGAQVDAQFGEGRTALIEAADEGHLEIVKLLVGKGANVNARRKGGPTVLMEAVDEGHLEIASFLIDKGADVNAKTDIEWTHINNNNVVTRIQTGWTALFEAIHEDHPEIVSLLINKGANVNATIKKVIYDVKLDKRIQHDDWTTLMEAVEEENPEMVKLLISKGANTKAVTKAGISVLDIAKETGNKDIIRLISGG